MRALLCPSSEAGAGKISFDQVKGFMENPEGLLWLDYQDLKESDVESLQAIFGFHELALEDAFKPHDQRPKVEEYDDYFFLVMQALSTSNRNGTLVFDRQEIDLFVGKNYVVSIHRGESSELEAVWDRALKRPATMGYGPDRLTYYLLDAVVDHYIEIVDKVEDKLDELEDAAVGREAGEEALQEIFDFKRELIRFRKTSAPLRDAVNELMSREFPNVSPSTMPYLRDIYDHLIRLSDMLDSYRDILTGAMDVYLAAVSNRLNEIMKRLTLVATVFMPLTFITGFWGMNFVAMPFRSHIWWWGSLAFMGAITLWMVTYFWRKRWM